MPITEADRHQPLTALEGAIGKEAAMTLADHLPPVGWADVATKRDLEHLEVTLDARFAGSEARSERRLNDLQRTLFFAIVGAFTANTGIVVAVLQMTRGG